MEEDSLERELKLRPFTTGDVAVKNLNPLKHRSEARGAGILSSTTTHADTNMIRPRAPRTRLSHAVGSSASDAGSGAAVGAAAVPGKDCGGLGLGGVGVSTSSSSTNGGNNARVGGRARSMKEGSGSGNTGSIVSAPATKKRAQKGNQNITELWDSLNRFSVSNMGRMRPTEEAGDDIHYINVTDEVDASEGMSSSSAFSSSSSSSAVPHKSRNAIGAVNARPLGHKGSASAFMQRQDPIETLRGGVGFYSNTTFSIPELPRGKLLTFNILSTWGDPHYLGLMGIEIFDRYVPTALTPIGYWCAPLPRPHQNL